jgi:ATP-dependent exoDNAse (exonuclease V) beta subunit
MVESADFGQAAYSPLVQVRKPVEGQPAVIALPLPAPFDGRGRVTKTSVNRQLPETVCAFVDWLCRKSGWKVEEPDQKLVPIRPGHIAILFRRFLNAGDDLTRPYVKGLEARNLPHLLVGSKSYHQREEVETLRCALTAIEWPDDELSVYATLRGSLFAIPDRDLFAFRAEYGRLNPYRKYPEPLPAPYQPVAAALAAICDLHRERNRRPVAGTVSRLLEETRAHAAFVSRPGGQQVLANVRRVADLARNYEIAGGISFRGFVEVLAEEAEKARSQEAPVHEEGSDGVRLMSVHGAKGLEFPVVILADITASISQQDPDRYIDPVSRLCATRILRCAPLELSQHETEERLREREEGLRVAYVAATRARDLLVVPAVSDQPTDWWLSPLNPALYPSPGEARAAKPAPGCPKFGDSTMTSQPSVIQPGLHRSQADTEVVWWDSNLLELRVEEKESLNPAEVFADTPLGRRSEESYMQWKDSRERQIEQGRMPAIEITLATQAASPPPDAVAVEQATARAAGERPGGVRFGRLLHGVLRDAQLDADRGSLEKFARLHGRLAGATEEEIDAATVAVAAVLAHPLLEAARSAAVCHREWPVAARMGERQMLEGVIDLLYREADGWRIVDFKTDADLADRLPQYERQLQWYAWAVSRITGLPVRATLLAV